MVLPEIYLDPWEAYDALRPLALFVVSVTLYGVFVFHFYRFLARKEIFRLNLGNHNEARHPFFRKTVAVAFYLFKNLFLFPLFVAFWFLIMSGLLLLMGKNNSVDSVMLAAIGIVAAIRICAYYNGALATDIAKILPFALLGIMLIDSTLVRIPQSTDSIQQAAMHLETMVYYLSGVVALEFVLRMLSGIFGLLKRSDAKEEPAAEPASPASAKVEQTHPDAPVPAYIRRPVYGPEQVAGAGASPVYGRSQPGFTGGAVAGLTRTARPAGDGPYLGSVVRLSGTGVPSRPPLHESPGSGPLPHDTGRRSR